MEEKLFRRENKSVYRLTQQTRSFWQNSFALNCLLSGIFLVNFFLVCFQNKIHELLQVFLNMPQNPFLVYSFLNLYVFYWSKNLYIFQNILLGLWQLLKCLCCLCSLLRIDQLVSLGFCFKHWTAPKVHWINQACSTLLAQLILQKLCFWRFFCWQNIKALK